MSTFRLISVFVFSLSITVTATTQDKPKSILITGESFSIDVTTPAKELPRPLPNKKASMEEWTKYSFATLHAMFPEENQEILRTSFRFLPDSGILGGFSAPFGNIITLNIKLVRSVAKSPEEFAVLLGHEFGHFIVIRDQNLKNYDNSFAGEGEPDLIGTLPLKNGSCHLAKVIKRLVESSVYKPLMSKEDKSINLGRITRLESMCESWK